MEFKEKFEQFCTAQGGEVKKEGDELICEIVADEGKIPSLVNAISVFLHRNVEGLPPSSFSFRLLSRDLSVEIWPTGPPPPSTGLGGYVVTISRPVDGFLWKLREGNIYLEADEEKGGMYLEAEGTSKDAENLSRKFKKLLSDLDRAAAKLEELKI